MILLKRRGQGLLEVLLILAASSITTVAVTTAVLSSYQVGNDAISVLNLMEFRQGLIGAINNSSAWAVTTTAGKNTAGHMDCLANATPCTVNGQANGQPLQDQPFKVYKSDGTVFYDSTSASAGVRESGVPCSGFSSSTGNATCPFRYDLKWSAVCRAGNCVNPTIKITAQLIYNPPEASRKVIDVNRYAIPTLYRPAAQYCNFDGAVVAEGQTVTAYQSLTVPSGSTCQSESRTCSNGSMSGSYAFSSCTVDPPLPCSFNGVPVAHGSNVTAYQTASVPFGSTCNSQSRACNNGVLSGSYTFATCTTGAPPPPTCTFNATTLASGASVLAFQAASVPSGSTCQSQMRVCNAGVLSGTYAFPNCVVNPPSGCIFNGVPIADGGTVTAYLASSVPFGFSCNQQTRTCNNGTLSGSYLYSNCTVGTPANCSFNGVPVADGASITAYQASGVPFGFTCNQQTRICSNGTLSGSYLYPSCTVGNPAGCTLGGISVADGGTITAYQTATVPFGSTCNSQARLCTNGTLSGSYTNTSCTVNPAASCTLGGTTVPDGGTITAYQSSGVPFGSTCNSEPRICTNGVLSGSFTNPSCTVGPPANCIWFGVVPHGGTVTAYLDSYAYGTPCQSQPRTCNNGVLSGTYTNYTCTVPSTDCPALTGTAYWWANGGGPYTQVIAAPYTIGINNTSAPTNYMAISRSLKACTVPPTTLPSTPNVSYSPPSRTPGKIITLPAATTGTTMHFDGVGGAGVNDPFYIYGMAASTTAIVETMGSVGSFPLANPSALTTSAWNILKGDVTYTCQVNPALVAGRNAVVGQWALTSSTCEQVGCMGWGAGIAGPTTQTIDTPNGTTYTETRNTANWDSMGNAATQVFTFSCNNNNLTITGSTLTLHCPLGDKTITSTTQPLPTCP